MTHIRTPLSTDAVNMKNKILDWKDATTWDAVVSKGLKKCIGRSYAETLKTNAKSIVYVDCEDDGCALFTAHASIDSQIACVIEEIERHFDEIFVYHACRTNEPTRYYEKGIIPLSLIEAQTLFRERFKSFASPTDIDNAITAVSTETIDGVTHAIIDDRCFLESGGGHYLIYGSEYQQALVVCLPGANEYTRDILKKFGRATIFICRLPFSEIYDLERLASRMLADHFYRVAHNIHEVSILDYTVTLRRMIPASSIVRHYYPTRILDPCKGFVIWNEEHNKYEMTPRYR